MTQTTAFGREFNESRKVQGFQSQAHLDAFFAAFDHNQGCADCRQRDGHVLLNEGWQPTVGSCAIHQQLERAYFEVSR